MNGTIVSEEIRDSYGPDVNLRFLIDFIQSNAGKKQPFLAYYATPPSSFPMGTDSGQRRQELPTTG